jgi:hypothetical protein
MRQITIIKAKIEHLGQSAKFWSVLAWAVPIIIYIATLPTVPGLGSSAAHLNAALLGADTGSGCIVFDLLAPLFGWLPVGPEPWRVALLSALAGATAVWLIHDLLVRLLERLVIGPLNWLGRLAVWSVVMAGAFALPVWRQAVTVGPTTTRAAVIALLLWGLWRIGERWLRRPVRIRRLERWGRRAMRCLGASGLFLVSLLILFLPYYQFNRASLYLPADTHPFPAEYATAILQSLPPQSILAVSEAEATRATLAEHLRYLQAVQGVRPDVLVRRPAATVTDLDTERRTLLNEILADDELASRPLFATFPAEVLGEPLRSMSNGLVYAVSRPGAPAPKSEPVDELTLPAVRLLNAQPELAQLLAHYHYTQAALIQDERGTKAAGRELLRAVRWDSQPFSPDFFAFQKYRAVRVDAVVPPGQR